MQSLRRKHMFYYNKRSVERSTVGNIYVQSPSTSGYSTRMTFHCRRCGRKLEPSIVEVANIATALA
jgi:hypothetical protein